LVRNPGPVDSNQVSFIVRSLGSGNPPPFLVSGPSANPNPTYTQNTQLNAMGGTYSSGGESVLTYTWMLTGLNPASNVTFKACDNVHSNNSHEASCGMATFPATGSDIATYHIIVRVTDTVTQFSIDSVPVDVTVIRDAKTIVVSPQNQNY